MNQKLNEKLKSLIIRGFLSSSWSEKNMYNILKNKSQLRHNIMCDFMISINSIDDNSWEYIGQGSYGVVMKYKNLQLAVKVVKGTKEIESELKGYNYVYNKLTQKEPNQHLSIKSKGWNIPLFYFFVAVGDSIGSCECVPYVKSNHLDQNVDDINKQHAAFIISPMFPHPSVYHLCQKFNVKEFIFCCLDVADKCKIMIDRGFSHNDLYTTNILLDKKNRRIEMIDFGMSRSIMYSKLEDKYIDYFPFILNMCDKIIRQGNLRTRLMKSKIRQVLSCMCTNNIFIDHTMQLFNIEPKTRINCSEFQSYITKYLDKKLLNTAEDIQFANYFKYITPNDNVRFRSFSDMLLELENLYRIS